MMRNTIGLLLLAVAGCREQAPEQQSRPPATGAAAELTAAPTTKAASMMPIPDDPAAVKRLQQLGYTVHQDEGHLHPPGVKECPAMAGGPVM